MSGRPASLEQAPTVLTVERGLQVLRAFRSELAPLTNSELVRRCGLSKATVSRLTSTLLQLGFVRHVPGSREFELAPGALGIGHAFVAASGLLQAATPLMQDLADRLNVSVALAIPDGVDMLYVGYRASRRIATLRMGVGSVLPMGTTAIGHAVLWALPPSTQKQLIAQLKRNAGRQASSLERSIRTSFDELGRTGTCAVMGRFQRDAYAFALPVIVGHRHVIMGLSCGKTDAQADLPAERKRICPALLKAGGQLQEVLATFDGRP